MFENRPFHLLQGDNFEHLKTLEDNSIDSCVTDPPYGLGNEPNPIELLTDWIEKGFHEVKNKRGFMGKEWDAFVPQPILWKEIFRVLKPGSHLLAFCGTRTYDLMALAIRLSGFEIRDNILVIQNGTPEYHYLSWIYGSGFPKSMNISKAIDKELGVEQQKGSVRTDGRGKWELKVNREKGDTGVGHADGSKQVYTETLPTSEEAQKWNGYGTAVKPAHEHIIIARKPIEKGLTVAKNVLKYGTGAINIDGCRIGGETIKTNAKQKGSSFTSVGNSQGFNGCDESFHEGRFPTNVIYDGNEVEQELDDLGIKSSGALTGQPRTENKIYNSAGSTKGNQQFSQANEGSVKRFFYTPKTSQLDRNEGLEMFAPKRNADRNKDDGVGGDNPRNRTNNERRNFHPTVKPVELMRYLCRLVTPQDGICLDPYMGSGSTGKACLIERFKFIGMELEDDHFQLAEARLLHANLEPVRNIEVETDVSDLPLFQKRES